MGEECDRKVLSLCDAVWQWRLAESPELASFCGFYQYDNKWDDISEEAYIQRQKKVQEFILQAEGLDVSQCSSKVQLSYNILLDDLKSYLQGSVIKSYLVPINYLEGIHVDANLTVSYMKFESEQDFETYIARLKALPRRIESTVEVLKKGVQQAIVQHLFSVQSIPSQIDVLVSADTDNNGLLEPFKRDNVSVSGETLSKFQGQAKEILHADIFPALERLKEYIEKEYLPKTRPHIGISSLRDGSSWYQECLNFHLTCSMTPKEVHDLGLQEVARIRKLILKLSQEEGLGDNFAEIMPAMMKKQRGFFKTKDSLVSYVENLCRNTIRGQLAQFFKGLPDIEMKILPSPEYMKNAPQGFYLNGTPDGSRDGSYMINCNKLDECLPCLLTALSLHEGEPGHHLQGSYALANSDHPDFRRYSEDSKYYLSPSKFSFCTAYVEGWGLYCEALGEEMGVYKTNLEMLGRYGFESLRACRLVVDTGMHAFGWSKDKAVQFMVNNCLQPKSEIEDEVNRYITWPGQACAYKVGELKIWEIRRKAEKALGPRFDLKDFHHLILSCGAVSLRILEQIVEQYVVEAQS